MKQVFVVKQDAAVRKKRRRPEQPLHIALVTHLRARLPKPWLVFHVPNGGGRSKAEAGIFKAMGVLAGIPDLFVIGPSKYAHPDFHKRLLGPNDGPLYAPSIIAIELKAPPAIGKRGPSKAKPRLSEAQRDTINALGLCGIPTLIVNDLDEALRALSEMGVPLKGRSL